MLGKASESAPQPYDPLRAHVAAEVETRDLSFVDAKRNRMILLRVYASMDQTCRPVVLFSHGLGGSRENNAFLAKHWASCGYRVVVMQHAGSDSAVWKNVPLRDRMRAMRSAASLENFLDRTADVTVVLCQLEKWNAEKGNWLAGRMELKRVGMSGHSFGAITTQAVSGQSFPLVGKKFADSRIAAAIALSPAPPELGDPAVAFGSVKIPWLLMTGTKDQSPIGNTTPADRLKIYPALPAGGKYELVLDGANHMTFSDKNLLGLAPRDSRYHNIIIAVSTAFWDACLQGDREAKGWLEGQGCKAMLAPVDHWQWK